MATQAQQNKSEPEDQTQTSQTVTIEVTAEQQVTMGDAQKKHELALVFKVDSNETFEAAADELKSIKAKYKELDSDRKLITKPMDEAKKRIMDLFRKPLSYLGEAEKLLKRAMIDYQNKQEIERQKEEARLQELARKKEERLRKRAEKAAEQGKEEKAEMLEEQADSVPVPVVTYQKPQTTGISTRKTYHAEVTNPTALLKGVLDGSVPRAALKIDQQFLNKQATALKRELNYPGVVVKVKSDIAARAS